MTMPVQPPTPDDFEAARPLLDKLYQLAAWLGGMGIASYTVLRLAGKVGKEQRKYEEIREDIDALKAHSLLCLTHPEHIKEQQVCQANIRRMVEVQVNDSVRDIKDQLSDMNGTLCYFMGQLNIDPPDNPRHRRRTDPQRGEER